MTLCHWHWWSGCPLALIDTSRLHKHDKLAGDRSIYFGHAITGGKRMEMKEMLLWLAQSSKEREDRNAYTFLQQKMKFIEAYMEHLKNVPTINLVEVMILGSGAEALNLWISGTWNNTGTGYSLHSFLFLDPSVCPLLEYRWTLGLIQQSPSNENMY